MRDVPAKLTARVRVLDSGQGRKTDPLTELRGGVGWFGGRLGSGVDTVPEHDRRQGRPASGLVVPRRGRLEATGDLFEPYRLVDADGLVVAAGTAFFRELSASGQSAATQRSCGVDLLRWFRFLWAVAVAWNQATRVEARDFFCWVGVADKPVGRIGVIPTRWRTRPGGRWRGR